MITLDKIRLKEGEFFSLNESSEEVIKKIFPLKDGENILITQGRECKYNWLVGPYRTEKECFNMYKTKKIDENKIELQIIVSGGNYLFNSE